MEHEWVLMADKSSTIPSFVFNERVTAMDYSFMQYSELVSEMLFLKMPFLRKADIGIIWYIFGQKSGVFMLTDLISYPHPPRSTRAKPLLHKLRKNNFAEVFSRHSRKCTNVYILTPEARTMINELYQYLLLLRKIPVNRNVLGNLIDNPGIIRLCMRQNSDCDVIKEKYMKYIAKKR